MALFLSACCLVSATILASLAQRFARFIAILEIVAGALLVAGLAMTGWYLKIRP